MADPSRRPPEALVRSLLDGASRLSALEWREEVASTNAVAAEAAASGVAEIAVYGADVQTAGRGRHGRAWQAPSGTSLQVSFLLRPQVPETALPLLPLLVGTAVAEVAAAHAPGAPVALKWPNDLIIADRKAAGILAERAGDGVVAGVGINTDWRGVDRPPEIEGATSLAEEAGGPVDRWRVLAGLVGVLVRRYDAWQADAGGFLEDYRERCATLGRSVRVLGLDGSERRGTATDIAGDGSLLVETADGTSRVLAGDVSHLRPE